MPGRGGAERVGGAGGAVHPRECRGLGPRARYLHVCRPQQQVTQWAVVVGGEDVVFRVNHVQPQGPQVPRLQAPTAIVSGLKEVPVRRTRRESG